VARSIKRNSRTGGVFSASNSSRPFKLTPCKSADTERSALTALSGFTTLCALPSLSETATAAKPNNMAIKGTFFAVNR